MSDIDSEETIQKIKQVSGTIGSLARASNLTKSEDFEEALKVVIDTIEKNPTFHSFDDFEEDLKHLVKSFPTAKSRFEDCCVQLQKQIEQKDLSNSAIPKWLFICKISENNKRIGDFYRKLTSDQNEEDFDFRYQIDRIPMLAADQLIESGDIDMESGPT